MTQTRSLRHHPLRNALLIGASATSLIVSGGALAQNRVFGGRGGTADPASAAASAAAAQAARAAQTGSASQRAIEAFRRAAQSRAAMGTAQAAARAAAQAAQSSIANGLAPGGLQVANGIATDPALWVGAKDPTQATGADGRTAVTIEQTRQKAILTWDSFNIGRETDLSFRQAGTDWVALNRVTDAGADPSRILGSIKAPGSVYILNRNGVVFGGTAQVNVRNLVAGAVNITNDQFLNRGIYSALSGATYAPVFTDAGGAVTVEAGAQIATSAPTSVTAGGGFVLLVGSTVTNAGTIVTPRGQTLLSAGDDFIVRRGFGTEENLYSTTRGNEVRGLIDAGSLAGTVINTGQIEAAQGDITLAGRTIRQDGVLYATTSVNQRGTIHLLNSASDAQGSVTLGKNSLTLIAPEIDSKDTALDGQRDALIAQSAAANLQRGTTITGGFDDRSLLADRLDQSRVEIVTGGDVLFEGGSQTMANGGQVAVQANAGRITVAKDASIDVSGVMGVALDMASNSIKVNVQGNELRDSPANRDAAGNALKSRDVWIDVRELVLLPDGTGGYDGDRWYTKGGLLELGGYIGNTAHTISEWAAVGGTITLAAHEVVAQAGARLDISGGSLDYAGGYVQSSLLLGADGRLYDIRNAPAFMQFVSVGNAFQRGHKRWGEQYTQTYANRLFSRGTSSRWEDAYSIGRDAGQVILSTPTALMEADILAEAFNGDKQTNARAGGLSDGYKASQFSHARNGTLAVGDYTALGRTDLFTTDIRIGAIADTTADLATGQPLSQDRTGTIWLDADRLNAQSLGTLKLGTRGAIAIETDLTLANGGNLDITAPLVNISANVTARSGSVHVTNQFTPAGPGAGSVSLSLGGAAGVSVAAGATLDVRGIWINPAAGAAPIGLGYRDGGTVTLESSQDVTLAYRATIDVSSGAALLEDGTLVGGRGGSVRLSTDVAGAGDAGRLTLDGDLRGYGVAGGSTLSVQTGRVLIAPVGAAPVDGTLLLAPEIFSKGFGAYEIVGNRTMEVADRTRIDVTMPVYRQSTGARGVANGGDPIEAMELWTPPVYIADAAQGSFTQRQAASLTLQAGNALTSAAGRTATSLTIGKGSSVSVDPGQTLTLSSAGQLTVEGTLNAFGGKIALTAPVNSSASELAGGSAHSRSIWIGENAVLDAAARAATANDALGRTMGLVRDGGSIVIGGAIDAAKGIATASDNFIVVREGAVLDASGTQGTLDVQGLGRTLVASSGGTIAIASNNGLYLDGAMRAEAGSKAAAGGKLAVALEAPVLTRTGAQDAVMVPRELVIGAQFGASPLPSGHAPGEGGLVYGQGRIGVDRIAAGGFGTVQLLSNGTLSFDGTATLAAGQSVQLFGRSISLSDKAAGDAAITIKAPHVLLSGIALRPLTEGQIQPAAVATTKDLPLAKDARFTVDADLVEVRQQLVMGTSGTINLSAGTLSVKRRGFGLTTLSSRGDIRFLGDGVLSSAGYQTSGLLTGGDVLLRGAQVYPGTNVDAAVTAGLGQIPAQFDAPFAPGSLVRVERTPGTNVALPDSAFGSLTLLADVVEQAGVVRAPLGFVQLGTTGSVMNTSRVTLLPGSVTSVSGAGLAMPYGGTVDGVTYKYDGVNVQLAGIGGTLLRPVGLTLAGDALDVQASATVDLSGGGALAGAGFTSGRGGSVDARLNPLASVSPGYGFSSAGASVYAIVPGKAGSYAPVSPEAGAGDPLIGQQVTLDGSVPGLPAGTYTLMPSTYSVMPGAFRIEVSAQAGIERLTTAANVAAGSYLVTGRLGIANTGVLESLSRSLVVTPAAVARNYSSYNDMSYSGFVMADAARIGVPRAMLEADARTLRLKLGNATGRAFRFGGNGLFGAAKGGYGGALEVTTANPHYLEILGDGALPTVGFTGPSLYARDLNAIGASRMLIGGQAQILYGKSGNLVDFSSGTGGSHTLVLREGAVLRAPEVFLRSDYKAGGITIEAGAGINTLGMGKAAYDSADGYVYNPGTSSMVVASNGWVNLQAPSAGGADTPIGPGSIRIGACATDGGCGVPTGIYSETSLAFATTRDFLLDDSVRYGTRNLVLASSIVNLGENQALTAAQAAGVLPDGLALNQTLLDRLLRGDTSTGAPALQTFVLTAGDAVNVFGSVTLDTIDPVTGKSTVDNFVLGTPALYGAGSAGDVATIRTGNLVWSGATKAPGNVVAGGAGTGHGKLTLEARRITFGYGPNTKPQEIAAGRLALGFASVDLIAGEQITANHVGNLSVYEAQGAYEAGKGYAYSGGALNVVSPVVTGSAGSVLDIAAGGAISVTAPAGVAAPRVKTDTTVLGAALTLKGSSIALASSVILPSGKLTLDVVGDIVLTNDAQIDVSGREIAFNEVRKYSWGGDVILRSSGGNIRQAAGSTIDLSARNNAAGSLTAMALSDGAGTVDLAGAILGSASGTYDAGGTMVPYRFGAVDLRAQTLVDFAGLNARLNEGGVNGARAFQIKQGDLTIGDEVRAGEVVVSLDGGALTVNGTIDASGAQVGTIRLAARDGLTVNGTLDAHGQILRVDSYGKIIDSPNRAIVELDSGKGALALGSGARIDLRHGTATTTGRDGLERGTLTLRAPRLGTNDVAIDASGALNILGARSISIDAMRIYDGMAYGPGKNADGRDYQVIDQAYLDRVHADSDSFIQAALGNAGLMGGKLAGLNNAGYRDAFHLRPGVELRSAMADGDLVVQGDIDLSGYRYNGVNPAAQRVEGATGSGEAGYLAIRAGGDLSVYGSVSDGFAPPPQTPDDKGWLLLAGREITGGDITVPRAGVVLDAGTTFRTGYTLNYDVTLEAMLIAPDTILPVEVTLSRALALLSGTVLGGDVHDAGGNLLFPAGTLMKDAVTLPAGTKLGAGNRMATGVAVQSVTWPKGVPLPGNGSNTIAGDRVTLALSTTLPVGALIPRDTNVVLPGGAESIDLRPSGASGRAGFAVASLLPQGSQSFTLRLVAGADLSAADGRTIDPFASHGTIRLADSHYGMSAKAVVGGAEFVFTAEFSIDTFGTDKYAGKTEKELDVLFLEDYGLDFLGMFGSTIDEFCSGGTTSCVVKVVGGPTLSEESAQVNLGDVKYAGLTESELEPLLLADFGVGFLDLMGQTLGDFCAENPLGCVIKAGGETTYEYTPSRAGLSVIRTGAADLDMIARGDVQMNSLYGVYTAGTASAVSAAYDLARPLASADTVLQRGSPDYEKLVNGGADSTYHAWYPVQGGNLAIAAGGDLNGSMITRSGIVNRPNNDRGLDSRDIGNWLWRQGTGAMYSEGNRATAWWINFGTYAPSGQDTNPDQLLGFTGFGTLGGGNLSVRIGGDMGETGYLAADTGDGTSINPRSQGVTLAVGSTGRVGEDGSLVLTGGGDMDLRIGGTLGSSPTDKLSSQLVNLRGHSNVRAASIGDMQLDYGDSRGADTRDARAFDPFTPHYTRMNGSITLAPGDSVFDVNSLGTIVLKQVDDPGRVEAKATFQAGTAEASHSGTSWFSLWTDNSAINLFSAGGDVMPQYPATGSDYAVMYPPTLRAIAANGSLYYGYSALYALADASVAFQYQSTFLAPSSNSRLEMLAMDSINAEGYSIGRLDAPKSSLATIWSPGYTDGTVSNTSSQGNAIRGSGGALNPLIAFGTGSASMDYVHVDPALFYAVTGDLVGVSSGRTVKFDRFSVDPRFGQVWYQGGGAVWMKAGRDIVGAGALLGTSQTGSGEKTSFSYRDNLFIHNDANDVSVVSAARDILYSSFDVAGPGTLEISAGRNILMEDKAAINSIGAVAPGDSRSGASIALGAGMTGVNWNALRALYLDPANLADPGRALADPQNAGKVAKTYQVELSAWLQEHYGFTGTTAQALTYFGALSSERQRVFLRTVYDAELRNGGREYNDAAGPRFASYLRGRQAIATLFPDTGGDGAKIFRSGDITMYGGSGVRTNFGGDINLMAPGGRIVLGVQGAVPPASAGAVTQGAGNISTFSEGSLLLGLSRIMTTFGGSILSWSETGDINAGRGARTTVVYTPAKRTYDAYGNVALAPQVPSSGAGIGTLAPIPEVPAGDIDLIAPLGTIDAGEAGIRVSGNINLAALQVLNAANIQVKGNASGIPQVAVVNTGALTAASAATGAVVAQAAQLAERSKPLPMRDIPAIITSRLIGFGDE